MPPELTRTIDTVPTTSAQSAPNAVLVFDGDCGFCTSAVNWLERTLPRTPTAVPYQWADLEAIGLTMQEAAERVWFVTTDREGGHQYGGHLAVAAVLRGQPAIRWKFIGYLLITFPFSLVASIGYALIARYRHRLPGGTPACRMPDES